ncbi:DUF3833 family protein [Sandarakinorhabdus sp.]|uniref:DUF3833 family protein n=1 Tax=Sandarakinorhabdus sp. TaxID=1916663 RepID=UPI003341488E
MLRRANIRSIVGVAVVMLAVLAGVSACVPAGRLTAGKAALPQFDVAAFFAGRTQGRGILKIAMRRTEPVSVDGSGQTAADGMILLDQGVRQGNRDIKRRQWQLRAIGPGRYAGTLSDAAGPVVGEVTGNVLHLRFALKGGFKADQWLTLQPGGNEARNVMIIRKFGMPVARLDEVIMRVPG